MEKHTRRNSGDLRMINIGLEKIRHPTVLRIPFKIILKNRICGNSYENGTNRILRKVQNLIEET